MPSLARAPRSRSLLPTLALAALLALGATALAPSPARAHRALPPVAPDKLCRILGKLQGYLETALDLAGHPPGLADNVTWVNRAIDDRCVALNEIQVIGTHNSYHLPPRTELLQAFVNIDPAALEWEYDNLPLYDQLEQQGIRQFELDVFADPEGGLYASRLALALIGQDPASGEPALDEPGFKVLHVQHVDFETTCLTFVACLEEVKSWSDAHPEHVPIMILIEAKDEIFFPGVLPPPVFIGAQEFRDLEDEIRQVFPEDRIVKPDDVRGDHASLEEAILADGWPRLGAVRGKLIFALDNGGKRDLYVDGDPSLEGRLIFPNSLPGEPDAGFVKVNDPLGDPTLIPDLVGAGYVVRTRADAGLVQGRTGDTTQRDAALASGAQWVSTDFPDPSTIVSLDPTQPFDPSYQVDLPGGLSARCNPVAAPDACRSDELEPGL